MPFRDIVGHAVTTGLLSQAVAHGRVPQSLLFAGPEGVGKRAVATALAQAVNCPIRRKSGGDDACGACATCTRIGRGIHTDVVVIDKGEEPSIKIGILRERLLEVIGYRPFEADRRVFIIDPADEMTVQTQDALLKTLEEPPPAAVLVLVTAYADTLLATIQSRCRRIRFGPLPESEVARVLVERLKIDRGKAAVWAAVSGGSVARALAAEKRDLASDRSAAMALVEAGRGRVGDKLKAAAKLAQHGSKRRDREALGDRLAIAASLLRDLSALGAGSSRDLANIDLEPELRALASTYNLPRLTESYAAINLAQEALDRNASPKIVADWVALSI